MTGSLPHSTDFRPEPSLIDGVCGADCRAVVILPARNEEHTLGDTLDALSVQTVLDGRPLSPDSFEVHVLLNNCTDDSAGSAQQWAARHPHIRLYISQTTLPPDQAHVGTARRLLMDTAWHRLKGSRTRPTAILSTDADTLVAPDWIVRNLEAIERGADAVGGAIQLRAGDLEALPEGARRAYLRDREYQRLVAELESWLDPQAGDPWPRHLEHFGASLACTPAIYERAGGLPPVKPLEDVAFVDRLRRVDARLRHEPTVIVSTSARLDGRVDVGLSGQLRLWQEMSERGNVHRVLSCDWLIHRFRTLRALRDICEGNASVPPVYAGSWRERLVELQAAQLSVPRFLEELDCDRLIAETFHGEREGEIVEENRNLTRVLETIREARPSAARRSGTGRNAADRLRATQAARSTRRAPGLR